MGTPVSIVGSNFTGVTSVTFGSVAAVIGSSSATDIQTTVPAGATNAPITVATPNGTNSSAQSFIILDGSGTATVQNGTAPYTGRNIFPRSTPGQTLQLVYTPPAAGTIEGLQIAVPTEFGAPLQANVSVSGGGGSPVVAVSGQNVTVTGLAATTGGNVTVSISDLTMPDTSTSITNSGAYPVSVQSRGSGGAFAALVASPSARVTIPLANVRSFNANYSPVLSNSIVAVQGTANVPKLANRGVNAAIQDSTWGVVLDCASAVLNSNLVRGNIYAAIGQITQFQGVVQISLTNAADLLNLGAGVDPAAETATVSQFTNTNTAPGYQSRVTRIDNLNKLSGTWATTNSVILTNTSGEQVTVFIPFNSTATTEPTYPVNVTGIGGQSASAAPFNTGWRIQPRDPADLTSATLPSISVNPSTLSLPAATQPTPGASTNFTASGSSLSNNVTVSVPGPNFAISTNNTDFTNTLTLFTNSSAAVTNTPVFVRLTAASAGTFTTNVSLVSDSASNSVSVTGTVNAPPVPALTATPPAITNLATTVGTPSPAELFTASGVTLSGNITVTATDAANFAVSTNNTNFASSVTLITNSSGAVPGTPVYVRLTGASAGNPSSTVSLASGALSTNVVVSGTVSTPTVTASPSSLTGFSTSVGSPSFAQSFNAGGSNLAGNIAINAPAGYEVSLASASGYASSLTLAPSGGSVAATQIFVRLTGASLGSPAGNVTVASAGATTQNVEVSGAVGPAPVGPDITVAPTSITNFTTMSGFSSSNQPVTVRATNLTAPVTLTAPANFEISTNGTSFSDSITLSGNSTTLVTASDSATNAAYAGGWTNGANGGTGFSAWSITSSSGTGGFAGVFIGNPTNAGITTNATFGANAFAMFANPTNSGSSVSADRSFTALQTGQTFSFQWAVNWDSGSGGNKGFNIYAGGTGGTQLLNVNQGGFPGDITLGGTNTGLAFSNQAMTWSFTLTSSNNLLVTSTARSGATNIAFSTNVAVTAAPDSFRWYASAMESGDQRQPYYNNLQISSSSGALGDTTVFVRVKSTAPPGTVSGNLTAASAGATTRNVVLAGQVTPPAPIIFPADGISLSGFSTVIGTPSTNQQITVSGTNLTANITVTPPPGWQISPANTNSFGSGAVTLPTNASGAVPATDVFVRLAGTNTVATNYSSNRLTLVSAAASNNVFLSGAVTNPLPSITVNPDALTNFSTVLGNASAFQSFAAGGTNLTSNITVTAPANFAISFTNNGTGVASTLTLTNTGGVATNRTVYVRMTGAAAGSFTNLVGLSSGIATNSVTVSGTVNTPSLAATPVALTNFLAAVNIPSASQAFTVVASNLTTNLVVSPQTGWQVSFAPDDGFANSLTLTNTGGPLSNTVFIRLVGPGLATNYSTNNTFVTISNTQVSTNVRLAGSVRAGFSVVFSPVLLDGFETYSGTPSTNQSLGISALGVQTNGLFVLSSAGFEIAGSNSTAFTNSLRLIPDSGGGLSSGLSVRIAASAGAANPLLGSIVFSNAGLIFTQQVGLSGIVKALPIVTPNPNLLSGFDTVQGTPSTNQEFNLTGENLENPVTITAPPGYEISTNPVSGFATNLTVTPATGSLVASDNAGNYGAGWTNGANGGFGFGAWTIASGTTNGGSAGIFVGNPTNAGIGGMAASSFGLFANPANNGNFVNASRPFGAPITVGGSFSFQWGNNYDAGAGNKGVNITDVSGSNIFNLNMGGSAAITLVQGTNAPVQVQPSTQYGTNVMTFTFARTASNTFRVSAPAGRDLGPGFTNTFTVTNEAAGFAFYASGLQAGTPVDRDSAQPYFNNLQIAGSGGGGGTPIYVRIASNAPVTDNLTGTVLLSSAYGTNRATNTVALQGRVRPAPTLTLTPASIALYNVVGYPSDAQSVRVRGTNLLADVVVTPPAGIEISESPTSGFTSAPLALPFSAALDKTLYVRIASSRAIGALSGNVVFSSTSSNPPHTATALLALSGLTGTPTSNANFLQTIYRLLLYRAPTASEISRYSASLSGGPAGAASNAEKSAVIMDIMGLWRNSTPVFNPQTNEFTWQTYDLNNEYVRSPSVLFAFIQRLGIGARLQSSDVQGVIKPFVERVRLFESSPDGSQELVGGLATANVALAKSADWFLTTGLYLGSSSADMLNYSLQLGSNLLSDYFGNKFILPNSAAGLDGGIYDSTVTMMEGLGLNPWWSSPPNRYATAAALSVYTVYSQAVLPYDENANPPYGGAYPLNSNTPALLALRNWQLQLSQASLNYQLWASWTFGTALTQSSVAGLLQVPTLNGAGPLRASVGQAFAYQVTISQNANSPINQAPDIYFSATGLPPGLAIEPSGRIIGTPTTADNYTALVTAQNIAGTSSQVAVQINVTGTQADNWMTANYPGNPDSLYAFRTNDTDGDGFDSVTEYAFGTDPTNANASIMTFSNNSTNAGILTIRWTGLTNQGYTVQATNALPTTNVTAPVWSDLTNVPVPEGIPFQTNGIFYQRLRTDVTNTLAPNDFYRIWTTFPDSDLQ